MEEKELYQEIYSLVDGIENIDFLGEIEPDEARFICDKTTGKVNTLDKVNFVLGLKELKSSYEDEEKDDHYFTAMIEGRKIATIGNRDLFRKFVTIATDPQKFAGSYNDYYDDITDLTNERNFGYQIEIETSKIKMM